VTFARRKVVGILGETSHVYTVADIAADPHYRARGMLAELVMDDGSLLAVPGIVPKLSATPGAHRRNPSWGRTPIRCCGNWV